MSSNNEARFPVTILSWKPLVRNTLRGFASIRLGASLKIHDIAIHVHDNGRSWAQLPSKPVIQQDGTVKRDGNGKIQYVPLMEWIDRAASDKFSESVIAAIKAEFPDAI